MASRKEQKEQLRREREEREAAAKAAERRRRTIGIAAAAVLVAAVVAVLAVVLVGGDDGGGGGRNEGAGDVLPDDGEVPEQKVTDLEEAAAAASCELKSFTVKRPPGRSFHDLPERVEYDSSPPTSGPHLEIPAEDGAYDEAPDPKELVHSMEHGRVVVWFKKSLTRDQRADLNALYEEDTYQMLITPDETGSPYAISATAWNAEPSEFGTGRLLGCKTFSSKAFDAIRTFKDEHRSNGPEAIP